MSDSLPPSAEGDALYLKVASALRAHLRGVGPNTLLPSEKQLGERFSVSRLTIRNALSILEAAGLVTRVRGRGTIANPRKITRNIVPMSTIEDDLRSQNIPLQTVIDSYETGTFDLPEFAAHELGTPTVEDAGRLIVRRFVEQQVVSAEIRYFFGDTARAFDPAKMAANEPISVYLKRALKKTARSALWEMEIEPCDFTVADKLDIREGQLITANSYIYRDQQGGVIEVGYIAYRIDRCRFHISGVYDE